MLPLARFTGVEVYIVYNDNNMIVRVGDQKLHSAASSQLSVTNSGLRNVGRSSVAMILYPNIIRALLPGSGSYCSACIVNIIVSKYFK